jgi:ferritin-like metal-binding protein YciE
MAKQTKGKTGVGKVSAKTQTTTIRKQTPMHSMMEKLFMDQLKSLYYMEKNQIRTLGRLAKKATTDELKDVLLEHQEITQEQLGRLDQVFELLGKRAQVRKCPAFDGLVEEADELLGDTEEDTLTRDVALIVSVQKIKHYEIAGYGCLTTLARTYAMQEAADWLQESLDEEKDMDQQLTYIAENNINYEAGLEEEE